MSSIFQFQAMLVAVVNAISGSMLSTERTVAYVLMTICLVLGVYEAYARGGDIRSLAGAFLKYIVAAFVIGYWTNFFSDAFTGFNQLANSIDNSFGAGDLLKDWTDTDTKPIQSERLSATYSNRSLGRRRPSYII